MQCKKIFPVIAAAYIINRRVGQKETLPSLISELYYDKGKSIRFDRRMGLLYLSGSKDLLNDKACLEESRNEYAARIKSFIFLSFLIHMHSICNITASFLAFDDMTNYLSYLTKDVAKILNKARKMDIGIIFEEDPLKNEIYKISLDVVSNFWWQFSGLPLYEWNKENFESFRAECNDLNGLPSEIAKIYQKKYEELTITEKIWIMQLFYRDFSQFSADKNKVYELDKEDFILLDDFHKEIFGKK